MFECVEGAYRSIVEAQEQLDSHYEHSILCMQEPLFALGQKSIMYNYRYSYKIVHLLSTDFLLHFETWAEKD